MTPIQFGGREVKYVALGVSRCVGDLFYYSVDERLVP